jgi:ankyrin repeat protein
MLTMLPDPSYLMIADVNNVCPPNPLPCYRSTLLHTAAMHSRTDCIPLLLSEGVDVTALDSKGRSALQLACLYSDKDTVQLLFDSGGWIDS